MHNLEYSERLHKKPVNVVVVGSINMDLSAFVKDFPKKNQTIAAKSSEISAGGKGLNQAVAAARAGANVTFIGCVGDDSAGIAALQVLKDNDVDTHYIKVDKQTHTGTANIIIADDGANMIAVSAGANYSLTRQDIARASSVLQSADVLLCQLECPLDAVEQALKIAKAASVITIMNPAPAVDEATKLLPYADFVTPNETEALSLTHIDPTLPENRPLTTRRLMSEGAKNAVVTLGSAGAYVTAQDGRQFMLSAFTVDVVNTTGAGDTFNGAFACAIARNYALTDATLYATAASGISVSDKTAFDSAPTHETTVDFIARCTYLDTMLKHDESSITR